MNRKVKEKERLARRDVERFRRMLRGEALGIPELKMLQRAHDRLLDAEISRMDRLLGKAWADGLKEEAVSDGLVKITASVPRYVYHGTSAKAAASILNEGITPRGSRAPNHPEAPSHPDCVYLTDAYAMWYALDSACGSAGGRGAVLEVDLEAVRNSLLPDEDALGPWRDPRGMIEDMAEGGSGFFCNVLYHSLHMHGTVAHRGPVPPSAIRRAAYVPYSSLLWLAVATWKDTTVRSAIRRQQQAVLEWAFDGGDDPFPVTAEELVMNGGMAEQFAYAAVEGKEQAQALIAAGVRADTLWRVRLMERPEILNREGIEVVPVSPEASDADTQAVFAEAVALIPALG